MSRFKIQVYKNDCVLERSYQYVPTPPDATREEITHFSYKSRRRLAFVASNTDITFHAMVTLTYPASYPGDGKTVKRQLQNFIRWLRHTETALEYLWFLEFQKRGAPHIHLLLDCPVARLPSKQDISGAWYRICGTGDEKHLLAGTRTEALRSAEGGKRYAVKYAMKMYQKEVPELYQNVGRFWGHSNGVKPMLREELWCFTYGELYRRFGGWNYKEHLSNYRVSILYNATRSLKP